MHRPIHAGCLDEAFGLAVGFRRIGSGADVLETECLAGFRKVSCLVAGTIVGHHPLHGDAESCIIGDGRFQKCGGADSPFVRGR